VCVCVVFLSVLDFGLLGRRIAFEAYNNDQNEQEESLLDFFFDGYWSSSGFDVFFPTLCSK
jgi:hypothetical protein